MKCDLTDALSCPTVTIGIPVVFLPDTLQAQRAHAIRGTVDDLVVEYHGARGYTYPWGHIIETRHIAPFAGWRIVPVELWDRLAPALSRQPVGVAQLLPALSPIVQRRVRPHLPAGLQLAGLQAEGRRSPHALFCLLLTDPAAHRRAQRWIERRLLPTLLPQVLHEAEAVLRQCLAQQSHGNGPGVRSNQQPKPSWYADRVPGRIPD